MAMRDPARGFEEGRARTSPMVSAVLDIERPDGSFGQHPLLEQHVALGRSSDLAVVLDHHSVSRRHAEIVRDPFGRWWIRDLGSTNGTTVNGERIVERVLSPDDGIGIGDLRLFFRGASGPPSSASSLGHSSLGHSSLGPSSLGPSALGPSVTSMMGVAVSGTARIGASPPGATMRPPVFEGLLAEIDDGPQSSSPSWVRSLRDLEPPKVGADHLARLLSFSRQLGQVESAAGRLELLCELLVGKPFHGFGAVVLRLAPDLATTVLAGPARASDVHDRAAPYLSRRLLTHLAATGEAAVASSMGGSVDLSMVSELFAAIACPLGPRREDGSIDLIYASFPAHLAGAEWVALVELAADAVRQSDASWVARHTAHAHAAIERDLETARRIQRAIVPTGRSFAGLSVELGFEPCRWVGGDYIDAVALPDGRVLLAVADVCGKGLQAALVTFSMHTMVRALGDSCGRGLDLAGLVARIAAHLGAYLPEDSFATMCCIALDPATGELESVNAGHLPPLVFDAEGRARELPSGDDPPLGLFAPGVPMQLTTSRACLAPGETLFLYTDGLTELRNHAREMLGQEQLTAGLGSLIARQVGEPLSAVAAGLERLLEAFRTDQLPEDDRAFVLCRRL